MSSTHKHVCCDGDIYDELFGLLSSMKKLYMEKVMNGGMKQDRFIDNKRVAASDLSSALYKARISSSVAKHSIRDGIKQMKKGHTTDM